MVSIVQVIITVSPNSVKTALINQALRPYGAAGLLLLSAALLYLFTLDNGLRPDELTGGDLITHQYAQVEARPSNAPGYPLYTMGGWIWFRLGQAFLVWALNPIQILSFYSTLWALAALGTLYLILLRVSGARWWVASLLTAFYATTFFFWYYSVTTEQYTSAVFQTLLIIWLAFKWDDSPCDSILLWLALVSGTMLANMVTTLFILPPLLWFILSRTESTTQRTMGVAFVERPGLVLKAVGLTLLPLLSYAYVYVRGALHPEWRGAGAWPSTWAWFIQFLTIRQGRDELAPGLTSQSLWTAEFPALMGQELTWLIFGGGLLGLALLGKRRAVFLYSTLLIYLIFSWGYRFGNWFQVIIPAYPIFVIGFAALVRRVVETAEAWRTAWEIDRPPVGDSHLWLRRRSTSVTRAVVVLLLTALLITRFVTNFPRANQRDLLADTGLDPGWALIADRPKTPALIVGDFKEQVALQYLATVWGAAALVQVITPGQFDSLSISEWDNRTKYITRRATAAISKAVRLEEIYPQAAGAQLIALPVTPRTTLPVKNINSADLDFGENLKLVAWEPIAATHLLPETIAGRGFIANWQIALYWQSSATLAVDYTISVRPLVNGRVINVAGENLIQDHQPVWGVYPTSRWRPGELVRDVYALRLPDDITPDAVQIVVYRATAAGFENLAAQTIRLTPIRQ